jgi:hypothetical protein
VKDENVDLPAESHNILNGRKNYISQFLNVHRVSDIKQIEIQVAELLVPDPRPSEVEIAIVTLKRYKLPGSDQILAELTQAGGETLWSETHKLINSIWNKEELPEQWNESIAILIYKNGDKSDCSYGTH